MRFMGPTVKRAKTARPPTKQKKYYHGLKLLSRRLPGGRAQAFKVRFSKEDHETVRKAAAKVKESVSMFIGTAAVARAKTL